MRKFLMATAACAVMVSAPVTGQSLDEAKQLLDVWLDAQKDYNDWPSVSVAFVKGQEKIYANAYGEANRRTGVKATTDTLYSICSISKLFTSIGVMQQRDAGKVSLRDPVGKHLDWYDIKQKYPISDDVTIEGILSHSSGLPREVDTSYWSISKGFPFPEREDAIAATKSQETLYRAWEHFQYSNLGLTLAGEIVASVSGENYHDYVRAHILDPLGLDNTFSEMPKDKHGEALSVGYGAPTRSGERSEMPYFNAEALAPAAGFASSANDLAKFVSWQLKLRDGEGDEVLDHNTLREMQRPHSVVMGWRGAFGLGFSMSNNDGGTLIGHGGYCPGYQSQIYIDPAKNIGGVALINAAGTNPNGLIRIMFDVLEPALKSEKAEVSDEGPAVSLVDYTGIYDTQPWDDENYIMPWGKDLISVSLRAENPKEDMTKLRHVEEDTFARVRRDGSTAETITFMRDDAGVVVGYNWHGTVTMKKADR